MRRARPRISITQGLFAVTLTIVLVLAATIILYARHKSREQALIAASELMNQSVEIVRLRVDAIVDPIDSVIAYSRFWSELATLPTAEGHPARDRFVSLIDQYPEVWAIQLGFDNGDYYLLGPTDLRQPQRLRQLEAPPDAVFVEESILRSSRDPAQLYRQFLDAEGNIITGRTIEAADYDPRTRPWYLQAQESDDVVRTDVYTFASTQQPGITIARGHGDVVVGIDITLRELERFLHSLPQAGEGIVAVFRDDGTIIVQSTPVHGDTSSTASLIEAVLLSPPTGVETTEFESVPWITRAAEFGLNAGLEGNVLIAMPLATIVAPIDQASTNTAFVSVAIALVSIPIIWLVARRLSRPLLHLVLEADNIRDFELGEVVRSVSIVDEIRRLEGAMALMRAHLRTFALYVPKALVKQLIMQGDAPQLGGSNRDLTVLFLDLENFTAMSEHHAPEEVMRRISRYFEVVTQTLLRHDATIDKYIGDAVMAFWNAPNETADHVERACLAALRIVEVAQCETETWSVPGSASLRTRIGIHCGDAIVGNVGSTDRMNYTALGSNVNLAARLEVLNRDLGTEILVSASVVSRVGSRFEFRPAGQAVLRGFSEAIDVYELIAERSRSTGRVLGPAAVPLNR